MSEIDKSIFRIPGLESKEAVDFVAPKAVAALEIVVPKAVTPNLYEELTAISEEILECRSQILETC